MKYIFVFFLSLAFGLAPALRAQSYEDPRFGRVTDEERSLMAIPDDTTNAEAYVLFDRTNVSYTWQEDKGPGLLVHNHRRVKLLEPSSFDRADVELRYNRNYEKISRVQACIHLPSGGTIKLKKSDIIDTKLTDDLVSIKWTFPRVEKGSIIEYSYENRKNSITIPPRYYFQEEIPVRHAEYRIAVPYYYNYVSLSNTHGLTVQDRKEDDLSFGPRFNASPYSDGRIPHIMMRYAIKDQPAYRDEPYTNNFRDYVNSIRFQLQSVRYPGQPIQPVFSDWANAAKRLSDREDFGKAYRNKARHKSVWKAAEPVLAEAETSMDKILAAYDFVAQRMDWNGSYGIFATDNPDKVFAAGTGNSADANLILLSILHEAGLPAYPLMVTLRDQGAPIETYPVMTQFGHTMVVAEIDGTRYLLDVGNTDRSAGLPRIAALNGRGWVPDPENPRWIDLLVPPSKKTVVTQMKLAEDGMADVELRSREENYYAFIDKSTFDEMEADAEGPLVADIIESFPATELTSYDRSQPDEQPNRFSLEAKFRTDAMQQIDDYLYVRPLLIPILDDRLSDTKERRYPVDFPFTWQEKFISSIEIPEGYTIEEMPESVRMITPDESASCSFAANQSGNSIQVIMDVKVDRTFFLAEEYSMLRQLFDRIIDLQESIIVLKKAK